MHLSTTNPADRLPHPAGAPDRLTISRIDPEAETAKYVTARLAAARGLDPHRRALLEEELRSPCITELAVFRAFSGLLMLARTQFVVIDTAPTGHTCCSSTSPAPATGRRCTSSPTAPGTWSRR